jgi:hypothetical protein
MLEKIKHILERARLSRLVSIKALVDSLLAFQSGVGQKRDSVVVFLLCICSLSTRVQPEKSVAALTVRSGPGYKLLGSCDQHRFARLLRTSGLLDFGNLAFFSLGLLACKNVFVF